MQREFIITRQGRDYVLYAGLLDAAHRDGLVAIRTTLLQAPSPANGFTAICHVEATTARGTFAALGDADPENTPRAMANALVRLAETRAKARALADAINVAMPVIEEYAETSSDTAPAGAPLRSPASRPMPLPVASVGVEDPRAGPLRTEDPRPSAIRAEDAAGTVGEPIALPHTDGALGRSATRVAASLQSPRADAPDLLGGSRAPRQSARARAVSTATAGSPATAAQLDAIERLARALGRAVATDGLTRTAASDLITHLSAERYPPAPRRDVEAE